MTINNLMRNLLKLMMLQNTYNYRDLYIVRIKYFESFDTKLFLRN